MKNFPLLAKIPEVQSGVLSDLNGTLLDSFGETDAESDAAVLAFTAKTFGQAGELLGLGALDRLAISGGPRTCLLTTAGAQAVGVFIDASKPLAVVEKKVMDTLRA